VLKLGALVLLGLPLATAGFALSYGPYRLAGTITPRLVGYHDTLLGTGKLIIGSALVLLGWLVAALLTGLLAGGTWGILLLAVAPVLAYIALRWGESWRELREAISYGWLRTQHQPLIQHLVAQRHMLAQEVAAAAQAAETLQFPAQSLNIAVPTEQAVL
jgi:hypothetical protein